MKKYCRLCKKKETREQCSYGPKLYDKYSVDDATEKETADAAAESGITENEIENFSQIITEKSKSGDSSLRDWFGKSRSSDGKPGWVQLGGKYAGKPCAKQPGQTTKPKCGSSKMKRNLNKDEEEAAFRRKNRQDPNPDRKGKAINVKTESNHMKDAPSIKDAKPAKKTKVKYDPHMKVMAPQIEKEDCWDGYEKKGMKTMFGKRYPNCVKKKKTKKEEVELIQVEEEGKKDACYHKVKSRYSVWPSAYASGALVKCRKKGAKNWGNKTKKEDYKFSSETIEEGRALGRANKKGSDTNPKGRDLRSSSGRGMTFTKAGGLGKDKTFKNNPDGDDMVKSMYDKHVKDQKRGESEDDRLKRVRQNKARKSSNIMKIIKKEEIELTDAYGDTFAVITNLIEPEPIEVIKSATEYDTYELEEATRVNAETGNLIHVILTWKGKTYGMKMFFPQVKMPKRSEVQAELEKVYPGCRVMYFRIVEKQPGETFLYVSEGAAWTKKSGKNREGGLNEKGRKSYERENPGSDLKAPSKKVGNPRRASFCARMKGMKKKLTSTKTARDPDSRINKSLRAWNC